MTYCFTALSSFLLAFLSPLNVACVFDVPVFWALLMNFHLTYRKRWEKITDHIYVEETI